MAGPDTRIVVADLRIPFSRLVFFFVKCSLAMIPAAIILGLVAFVVSAVVAALLGGHGDVIIRRWVP
jgi:hypothetical protein